MSSVNLPRASYPDAGLHQIDRQYRALSPRIQFGGGGLPTLERLYNFEQRSKDLYEKDPALEHIITGGWLALEAAAHLPESKQRDSLLRRSNERFDAVADKRVSTNHNERLMSYKARMGLIVLNAYQTKNISHTIDDTPAMFADLLDDVSSDTRLRKHLYHEQLGLLGELIVGTTCSSMEILTLPASLRHRKPLAYEKPSFTHDLEVWCVQPTKLPTRPDRNLQVMVGRSRKPSDYYSNAITTINVSNDLTYNMIPVIRSLKGMYDGHELTSHEEKVISTSKNDILKLLLHPIGNDHYEF